MIRTAWHPRGELRRHRSSMPFRKLAVATQVRADAIAVQGTRALRSGLSTGGCGAGSTARGQSFRHRTEPQVGNPSR